MRNSRVLGQILHVQGMIVQDTAMELDGDGETILVCRLPNYLVLAQVSVRRGKPAWRRRWKSSTSKG
jgi:hypothetical protein